MNKEELSLNAFYYMEPFQAGGDIFDFAVFKYEEELDQFLNFLKSCTLEDFIYVIVILFKEVYPNAGLIAANLSEILKTEKNDHSKINIGKSKLRSDVEIMHWHYNIDRLNEVPYYLDKVIIGFTDTLNLEDFTNSCMDALEGKELELSENKITVKDSAIDMILHSSSQIEIRVNPEKVVRY